VFQSFTFSLYLIVKKSLWWSWCQPIAVRNIWTNFTKLHLLNLLMSLNLEKAVKHLFEKKLSVHSADLQKIICKMEFHVTFSVSGLVFIAWSTSFSHQYIFSLLVKIPEILVYNARHTRHDSKHFDLLRCCGSAMVKRLNAIQRSKKVETNRWKMRCKKQIRFQME